MIKKILKVFLYTTITIFSFSFSNISKVVAATNDSEVIHYWLPGYFSHKNNDGKYSQLSYIYANGALAYCVEPGLPLNNGTYSSNTNFNVANISEEKRKKLELIAAYGYNTTNHRTDRYYAATQELIWRELGINSITWHTDNKGGGSIDLSAQKNEILRLINEHNKSISFYSNNKIKINAGNVVLEDKNNVLQNYEIISSNSDKASITGNKLNIYNSSAKDVSIKLRRKNVALGVSLVYYKPANQKVATFKVSGNNEVNLNFELIPGSFELNKKGEKIVIDNGTFKYEEIPLNNVKYDLYSNDDIYSLDGRLIYKKGNLINSFETNEEGFYKSDNLYLGKYCLIESESNLGHIVDSTPYCFEITEDDNNVEINHKNYLPKGKLDFTKTDAVTGKFIKDTLIEVYTDEDKLIFSGYTNQDGKIIIDNLFTGKFYIKEKKAAKGYQISDEKIEFEIKDDSDIVSTSMKNKKLEIKVPKTYKDDYLSIGMFNLIGIGLISILYGKTKQRRV